MHAYKEYGIYGKQTVYELKSLEDFDDYEEFLKKRNPEFAIYDSNFYEFKEDFKKYIGKLWKDENNVEYKVIGIEDNNAWADWYWIMENIQDKNDIIYLLANSNVLKEGLQ